MKVAKCANTDNDVSWYAKSTQLLNDAASINTTNVSGFPVKIADSGLGTVVETDLAQSVPGIMTMSIIPSVGAYAKESGTYELPATAPINLAAKNIYSYVRHANSGSSNYDSPDLMMAILAADQVFSAIAMGIRAYGIAMSYDQTNRYTPIALLRAMGFDPDSVINNLSQFRFYINSLISRASVIWVPADMSVVNRHYWMFTNIYRDSEDSKAQYYMYVPYSFLKFEPKAVSTGSSMSVVKWLGDKNNHSVLEYFNMVTDMLDPIISDEDLGIMFGDMLKAYGASNLFAINQIPDNYTIMAVHNKEVLQQIHNANSVSVEPSNVVQKDGDIYQEFGATYRNNFRGGFRLINFWEHSPSPAEVMVSTRLHCRPMQFDTTNIDAPTASVMCATEYVRLFTLWYYDGTGNLQSTNFKTFNDESTLNLGLLALISKFDWAPAVVTYAYQAGDSYLHDTFTINGLFMDLDNYTELSLSTLSKLNTTALFSEIGRAHV